MAQRGYNQRVFSGTTDSVEPRGGPWVTWSGLMLGGLVAAFFPPSLHAADQPGDGARRGRDSENSAAAESRAVPKETQRKRAKEGGGSQTSTRTGVRRRMPGVASVKTRKGAGALQTGATGPGNSPRRARQKSLSVPVATDRRRKTNAGRRRVDRGGVSKLRSVGVPKPPGVEPAPEAEGVFVVALDPGHGGTNLGAPGLKSGFFEKHLTLRLAQLVAEKLQARPGVKIVLCRTRDELVPIRARVRCGNRAHANLFVSLHANASPAGKKSGSQRGFEIYVLPVEQVDKVAALAASEASSAAEAAWRAHRSHTLLEASLEAAKRVQLQLADALGARWDRGIKQYDAPLDVLQGLQMPGLLVEIGFLDHPEEGRSLTTAAYQQHLADALAQVLSDLAARHKRALRDPHITSSAEGVRRNP